MKSLYLSAFLTLAASCSINAPEPQVFTGTGIQVNDTGEISLGTNVVQTAAGCNDGQILVQQNNEWRCQNAPTIGTSTGSSPVILNDDSIPDDISVDNGILRATRGSDAVGIGTNAPAADAVLDITSTSKGLLLPRLTTAQRTAIVAPTAGLIVFDTDRSSLMFYNGNTWTRLGATEDNCPAGYTWDDSRTDVILCARGPDEMVKVGDVWVDRYESVVKSSANCSGTTYGTAGDDYPSSFPDNGQVTTATAALFACSVRQTSPSRHITWFQAQQACIASGKHLITNQEWQAASTGTVDPEMTGSNTNAVCNSFAGTVRVTGSAGNQTASSAGCISKFGAEDMIGNADEWTGDWFSGGLAWNTTDGQRTQWLEADANFDITRGLNGRALGSDAMYSNGAAAAVRRGGGPDDGTTAGVFMFRVDSGPFYSNEDLGFRCARR